MILLNNKLINLITPKKIFNLLNNNIIGQNNVKIKISVGVYNHIIKSIISNNNNNNNNNSNSNNKTNNYKKIG